MYCSCPPHPSECAYCRDRDAVGEDARGNRSCGRGDCDPIIEHDEPLDAARAWVRICPESCRRIVRQHGIEIAVRVESGMINRQRELNLQVRRLIGIEAEHLRQALEELVAEEAQ